MLDVAASPLRGAVDATLWRLAEQEARVLVTRDLDFPLPFHLGVPAGVILLRPRPGARGAEVVALFESFSRVIDWSTVIGAVVVVEPGRFRQRSLASLPKRR